jgi:hypothetical protein
MLVHYLFIVGIIVTIIGWFLENIKRFKWFMLRIAPEYIFGRNALGDLEKNQKIALTKNHEGFSVLLRNWPNLQEKNKVEYIGRSVAFISLGSQVKNDIQLIPYDSKQKEIPNRWSFLEACEKIEEISNRKLFRIGAFLFWCGITLSIISYIIGVIPIGLYT